MIKTREIGSCKDTEYETKFKLICGECSSDNVVLNYQGDARGMKYFYYELYCKDCNNTYDGLN